MYPILVLILRHIGTDIRPFADIRKSLKQSDIGLHCAYPGEPEQAKWLNPDLSLNKPKIATVAKTFKPSQQIRDSHANGGLHGSRGCRPFNP